MNINIINKIKPHVNKDVWNYLKINKLCSKYCEEFLKRYRIDEIYADNFTISNCFKWIDSKYGIKFWANIDYNYYEYKKDKLTKKNIK